MVDLHATWYYFAMKPKKPSQDRACDIPTNTTRIVKQQHLVFELEQNNEGCRAECTKNVSNTKTCAVVHEVFSFKF